MNTLEKNLTNIIGEQINSLHSEYDKYSDLVSILSEAKAQSVFSITFTQVRDFVKNDECYNSLSIDNLQYTAKNVRNHHLHFEVHELLTSQSIEYTFLKGFASARYYPDPLLRTMGDVDFIVHKKDIEKVDSLLRENGFVKIENAEKHDYHWAYKKGNDSVELHWSVPGLPDNDEVVGKYIEGIIEDHCLVDLENGAVYVPSDFHHGLVLLLHTISHMTGSGVGLRHICDWLVFQNSMTEDEFVALFRTPLKKMGLWTFAQVLTQIGVMYFECPAREWSKAADGIVCTAFLEDVFCGGNFGIKDDTRKSQAKLIQNQRNKKVVKGHLWKNGLVSINEKTKRDFPFLWKTILFRPIGWICVCVQYLFRIATGKRNNVFNQDIYKDASNRQSLYSELELFIR